MKSFIIAFICAFAFFNCATAQKNLLENGGFEDGLYGWNNAGVAAQTPWDFKSGKNSCAIVTTTTDNWVGIDQVVRIPRKVQSVEFSAWMKTQNVVKGRNSWDGAAFIVVFLDVQDKQMGDGFTIVRMTGTGEWTQSKQVIKMPEKAYSFKIMFAMANASGTLIIDDVTAVGVQ